MSKFASDVMVSGLIASAGILGWSYYHFHPEKLSPKMPYKKFRLLCIIMIVGGIVLPFIPILFPDDSAKAPAENGNLERREK